MDCWLPDFSVQGFGEDIGKVLIQEVNEEAGSCTPCLTQDNELIGHLTSSTKFIRSMGEFDGHVKKWDVLS